MNKNILIILFALILSGCAWIHKTTKHHPPSNQHMICAQLKQELLFNQNHPELNHRDAYTRRAQLMKDYRRYNCEQELNN